MVPIKVF